MVYTSTLPTFNRQFTAVSSFRWWSVNSFLTLLQTISLTYFPAHSAREAGLSLLSDLTGTQAPFSLSTRFPAGAYITDYDQYLNKLLYQLSSALAYSDRLLNKNSSAQTSNDPTYLAAKASFYNLLPLFFQYLSDPAHLYDQVSFETAFSFVWT